MSDIRRLFSPNQRFFILLGSYEIRMSHWITTAALWETASGRALLRLGDSSWSTEQVLWRADSTCLSVELRRYPGDAPALLIDIYPEQRLITPHPPADTAAVPFEGLEAYLELYYQQHRRARSAPGAQAPQTGYNALTGIVRWLKHMVGRAADRS